MITNSSVTREAHGLERSEHTKDPIQRLQQDRSLTSTQQSKRNLARPSHSPFPGHQATLLTSLSGCWSRSLGKSPRPAPRRPLHSQSSSPQGRPAEPSPLSMLSPSHTDSSVNGTPARPGPLSTSAFYVFPYAPPAPHPCRGWRLVRSCVVLTMLMCLCVGMLIAYVLMCLSCPASLGMAIVRPSMIRRSGSSLGWLYLVSPVPCSGRSCCSSYGTWVQP